MSKSSKDQNLQEVFDRYYNQGSFNKNHNTFKAVYDDINDKYTSILNNKKNKKDKLNYIKFERYRLENNKVEINSNPTSIAASFLVVLISICISIVTSFDNINTDMVLKLITTIYNIIALVVVAGLALYEGKAMLKYSKNEKIYDVSIKVLNDIEKIILEESEVECKEIERVISVEHRISLVAGASDNLVNGKYNKKRRKRNRI